MEGGPLADNGVVSAVFRARRPFHPSRLQDALDEVTDGVLRSRGVFWLGSRPDLVLAWESAGVLGLGPLPRPVHAGPPHGGPGPRPADAGS